MLRRCERTLAGESFSLLEIAPFVSQESVTVVWSHATGFHASAYTPLLNVLDARLRADNCNVRLLAIDARGHGETRAAADPAALRSWHVYYRDLVALLDSIDKERKVILAGHSMGATASVFAAAQRPGRVAGLVLVEPVFYPPIVGRAPRQQLMAAALRRRSTFASLQEAFNSYRTRGAFRSWSDEWLWSYVNGAFAPLAAGGYELRCSTAWEYQSFVTNEPWPWLAVARARVPATVLLAERYSSCPRSGRAILRLLQPSWRQIVVPGSTHMLTMEKPNEAADILVDAIHGMRPDA